MSASTQMSTQVTADEMTVNITQEIQVRASLETTFEALLEELGPAAADHEGKSMSMKIEAWPGGRWYRDLGNNSGHCWGHVQSIKKPTLLEFYGPLFMSYAVMSNVQYRLSFEKGVTTIKFQHKALGVISPEHREGMTKGWTSIHERTMARAEKK
jgi:hypothetical protein